MCNPYFPTKSRIKSLLNMNILLSDFNFLIKFEFVHRSSAGNYLRTNVKCFLTYCIIFVICIGQFGCCAGDIMGDQCDWTGNGLSLSSSQSRGVTPVYLRCSQGTIRWSYPRGALRVLLRLPSPDREFKGCIKISNKFSGARLFLEGQRQLSPLFSLEDGGHKQLIRCFQSKKGQAAIYVEAVDAVGFKKHVAEFSYDLQQLPRGSTIVDLIDDECRPCSQHEMARAFCTSDMVTRGTIRGIDDKEELELSQLTIKISKLLRPVSDESISYEDNYITSDFKESYESVRLNTPRHCQVQHGDGEFVFMARKKLGDLTIICAPRLEDWIDVVRSMNKDGTSHCVLFS